MDISQWFLNLLPNQAWTADRAQAWLGRRIKNHCLVVSVGTYLFIYLFNYIPVNPCQLNQSLRYVHSWLELIILISMSTNNPSQKSVVLESPAKPSLGCLFLWNARVLGVNILLGAPEIEPARPTRAVDCLPNWTHIWLCPRRQQYYNRLSKLLSSGDTQQTISFTPHWSLLSADIQYTIYPHWSSTLGDNIYNTQTYPTGGHNQQTYIH